MTRLPAEATREDISSNLAKHEIEMLAGQLDLGVQTLKVEYGTRPAVNDGSEHPSPYRGV